MSEELQATAGRSFWSGVISIGLVNVPVKLYTMVRDQDISFHYVRNGDGCPLKYQRVCTLDNKVVEWADVARGYEVRKGEYVILTNEELKVFRPESDRRIKLDKFVHYLSVDPVYFESNYILGPDKSSDAYALLQTILERKGMAGVGRFTMRTKEYPVLVHVYKRALILTTLRYKNEVVDPSTVKDIADLKSPRGKELELAERIIDNLTGEFNLVEYYDAYRRDVEDLIKKKLEGETIKVAEPQKREDVKDLMAALELTLQQMGKT